MSLQLLWLQSTYAPWEVTEFSFKRESLVQRLKKKTALDTEVTNSQAQHFCTSFRSLTSKPFIIIILIYRWVNWGIRRQITFPWSPGKPAAQPQTLAVTLVSWLLLGHKVSGSHVQMCVCSALTTGFVSSVWIRRSWLLFRYLKKGGIFNRPQATLTRSLLVWTLGKSGP